MSSLKTCPFCELDFAEDKIRFHMGVQHLGILPEDLDEEENETKTNDVGEAHVSSNDKLDVKSAFDCEICSKTLSCSTLLIKHKKVVHQSKRLSCEFCGKQVVEAKFQNHLNRCEIIHHRKFSGHPYQCQKCKRSFTYKQKLTEHQNVHAKFRFSCEFCKQTFASKYAKNEHVKSKHKKIKNNCESCGKSFNSVPALKYHVSKYHRFTNLSFNDLEQKIQSNEVPKVILKRISKDTIEKWRMKTFIKPKIRSLAADPDPDHSYNCGFCKVSFKTNVSVE